MTYALVAGLIAGIVAVACGYPFVEFLRGKNIGKEISSDGPETHMVKQGTPTMGGLLIVAAMAGAGFAFAVPKDHDVLLPVIVTLIMGAIGWYDDLGTLVGRAQREAHDRTGMILKLAGFAAVGVIAGWILYDRIGALTLVPNGSAHDIGPVYVVIVALVMMSMNSAFGVTDGLDMLEGSMSAVAFAAFGAIALMQEQTGVAAFCFVTVGALCGFLWFNAYPARVIMGDSGALPLGAALTIVGFMTGWWLLLPVIGVMFVVEILSSVIQIGSFRLRGGKRVFRMAPIHHHFEKLGMAETQVTVRFLVVAIAGALAGVALAAW